MVKEKKEGIVNVLVTHRGVQKLEVTFCDLRKTNKIKKVSSSIVKFLMHWSYLKVVLSFRNQIVFIIISNLCIENNTLSLYQTIQGHEV